MSSSVSLPLYNLQTGVDVIGWIIRLIVGQQRGLGRDFIRDNDIQHVQLGSCKFSSNSFLLIGLLCKKALSFHWYFVCAKTVSL